MIKRRLILVIALICTMLFLVACNGGKDVETDNKPQYEIIVDEIINVNVDNPHVIAPQLVDRMGSAIDSRFVYEVSDPNVEISYDGTITIHQVPQGDVSVTVTERNTETTATFTLRFVEGITHVNAIADTDGKLVREIDSMSFGDSVTLHVITNQGEMAIEPYCSITAVADGEVVDTVFTTSYDGSYVTLKAVGIGEGDLVIRVFNKDGNEISKTEIPFEIVLKDKELGSSILKSENCKLLSSNTLSSLERVVISDSVKDLSELSILSSLKTVVFGEDTVYCPANLSDKYLYRVKDSVFEDFYDSFAWNLYKYQLVPYKNSYDERYVIYHSEKGDPISFAMVDAGYSLLKMTIPGYQHLGWKTDRGETIEDSYVIGEKSDSLHLYSVLEANDNKIVFLGNRATGGSMSQQTVKTDATEPLAKNGFTRTGYTFIGWSTSETGGVEYKDLGNYTMGTDASYTLYAVWEANKNTLVLDANGGNGSSQTQIISTDATARIDENLYTRNGYTFEGWSTTPEGEVIYADCAEYTMGTDEKYTLYAVWDTITYTISYNFVGGTPGKHPETYTVESEDFHIGIPNRSPYLFAGWTGTGVGTVTEDLVIKKGTYGDIVLTANWASKITFNKNGGVGNMDPQAIVLNTADILNANKFVKEGYMFMGWSTSHDGNVEYEQGGAFLSMGDASYELYAVWAEGTEGLKFTLEDDHYIVSGYDGILPNVKIPANYKNRPVTGIAKSAFGGNTMIKELLIPGTVTYIEGGAFYKCVNLESLTMPLIVMQGDDASGKINYPFGYFFGTENYSTGAQVKQYALPTNATTIPERGTATYYYLPSALKRVTLVDGTEIPVGYFKGCVRLESITLADSFITVRDSAFAECTALNTVKLSKSLRTLESNAFAGCAGLKILEIPENIETVGKGALDNCVRLEYLMLPFAGANKGGTGATHFGYIFGAESYADNRTSVPASLDTVIITGSTRINSYAFSGCNTINEVSIYGEVPSIGERSFANCSSLVNVLVPTAVKSIGYAAFIGCSSLRSIELPFVGESISSTNDHFGYIFGANSSNYNADDVFNTLKHVTITSGDIKAEAFINCNKIVSVTLGNGVSNVGVGAFRNCRNLITVELGANVRSIGDNAFYGCYSLAEVFNRSTLNISTNTSSHGGIALYSQNVYTPTFGKSGIIYNDNYVFYKENSMSYRLVGYLGDQTALILPTSIEGQGYSIAPFAFCEREILSVSISDNCHDIGHDAFANCKKLNEVIVGSGVISVGAKSFANCNALSSATFINTKSWFAMVNGEPHALDVSTTSKAADALRNAYVNYAWTRDDALAKSLEEKTAESQAG